MKVEKIAISFEGGGTEVMTSESKIYQDNKQLKNTIAELEAHLEQAREEIEKWKRHHKFECNRYEKLCSRIRELV